MIERIDSDLKSAMLARDKQTVSTLRMLKSALENKRIALQKPLEEDDYVAVIRAEAKKRREAAEMYEKGDKPDLAKKELTELKTLEDYLPKQLSDEELAKLVDEAIKELGEGANMGQMIGAVIKKAEGRADGRRISDYIKNRG